MGFILRTAQRPFLKGAFWSGFYGVSALGITFVISVLSARLLGVHDYGSLQFVLSVTQLAQLAFGLGMATQILRASGEELKSSDPNELDILISRSVLVFLFLLFLAAIPGFAIWGWIEGPEHLILIGVALAFAVTQQCISVYRSALVGKSRFMAAGFGEFAGGTSALVVLGILLLVASTSGLDPTVVLLVRTATAALGGIFLYRAWKTSRPSASTLKMRVVDRHAMLDMARLGFPIMLIGVGAILNSSADIIMLGVMRSSAEVGEYHVATRSAGLIGLPLAIMMIPLAPSISRLHLTNRRKLRTLVLRLTIIIGICSLCLAAILLFFLDKFLGLFGPDFLGARNVAIGLGIAQLVNAAFGPMQQLLIMTGLQRKASWAVMASVVTNVGLNIILIPPYGTLGAVIGTGAGIFINCVINFWFVWRELFSEAALMRASYKL